MTAKHKNWFSAFHCSRLEYEFQVNLDEFKLDDFKRDIARIIGKAYNPKAEGFTGSTATRTSVDFHAHFSFRWNRRSVRASLSYFKGAAKPESGDPGPFTENLIEWFVQFLKNGQVDSDLNAFFHYPMKKPKVSLPIPMRIPLEGNEVEIIGMVVRLPVTPEGKYEAFATLYDDEVAVSVNAEKPINLREFDLHHDLVALSSVARIFVKEKRK